MRRKIKPIDPGKEQRVKRQAKKEYFKLVKRLKAAKIKEEEARQLVKQRTLEFEKFFEFFDKFLGGD